ncbi:hypothetical protein DUNSADRAFT_1675 [Dunaliella salina]|nr:hypothetical protein DUNSADRAFT_1675 [Dunaliella salina]|eukprot:KAF5839057.1 hypothetical protein DUNSADRAFT_1675 [Dunaliella salina]
MAIMEKRVQSRFLHRRIIVSSPLHFEVPDPAAPAAAGPSRRSTASDSNPKPPVQYGDTPLGMLEDMLCLPSIARQHSQEEASEVRRSGWDEVARASGGGRGGGSHAAEGGRGGAGASRAAAGWGRAGSVGRPGGRIAAGAGGSEAAAGGQAAGGMARSGGGGEGRDEERLQLSEACVAALPVWQSPDFVARHNQAVKSCVQDEEVKAVLLSMFSTQLTSSKLSTIARMALAEWDRELRQQQRHKRQQQQRTGGGDTAALGTGQQQRLHQQQQQRTGDWESAALGTEQQQQQQQREQQRHDLPVQQGSAPQHPQPQQQPPSQPAALQHGLPQPSPTANARKRLRTAPEPGQQPDGEPQPPLGTQPDHQPQDRGNGSSPVLLLQPWHVVAACQPLRAADSMVRLVCDLSVFQLYLLAGMVRLSTKKHAMYNFEMVWDECKSKQDSSGILRSYKESEKAAWRAFEALMDTGIAFYSDPAAEAKGRNMKYAGAVLRLTGTEVEEGLAAHGSCPDEIMRFIRMET